jgi:hypothetical protein
MHVVIETRPSRRIPGFDNTMTSTKELGPATRRGSGGVAEAFVILFST